MNSGCWADVRFATHSDSSRTSCDVRNVPDADFTAIPIGLVVATHDVLEELQLAYRLQLTLNFRNGTVCLGSIRDQLQAIK